MERFPKITAVVGTNASGKSALAVSLALNYSGEIISADSRQVYRGLDLGSGKITKEEMRGVPHHLLDIREPGEFYSMADFQRESYAAIDSVLASGKLPFLVGGTGLYVDAVCDGYDLSPVAPDPAYRGELETYDTPDLYRMLVQKEPDTCIEPNNRNRVMRRLEKLQSGDTALPGQHPRYSVLRLGVSWDRETLQKRIDERLARRMEQGMIEEVRGLVRDGVPMQFLQKLGLEYRFVSEYLTGAIPSEGELKERLSIAIRQFAKRQMTWFRRNPSILWLDMEKDPFAQACRAIDTFIADGEQ